MQKFAILKGIDKHELRELLDVIRETSLLSLEESDVVISIWKKDFSSIRVYAPDEHLLAKIDIFTRQPFDFFVDRHRLFSGQIELSPDDLRDIQAKRMSLGLMEQEEGKDYAELMTALENEEKEMIDFMLTKARQSPPEIEFHDMIFELLSLEERPERIVSVLKFLERHHRELIQEGKFSHAVHLLRQVYELRHLFSEENPGKAAEVDKFLEEIKGGRSIDLVRESIGRKNFDSLSALLDYFGFLGSQSVSLATELLDETQETGTRRAAVDYFDAITTPRVYRPQALTREEALNDMREKSGDEFNPTLLRAFASMIGAYPVGSLVVLDSGEIGIVFEANPHAAFQLRPKVKIIADSTGRMVDGEVVDVSDIEAETGKFRRTIVRCLNPDKCGIRVADYFLARAA